MKYFITGRSRSWAGYIHNVLNDHRIKLLMRVSFFNILLLTGSIKLLVAHGVHGQELDKIKIDIELQNESLPTVFKKIEKQTHLLFAYPNTRINQYPTANLVRGVYNVKEVLEKVLTNTPFQYWQKDNHIIIFLEEDGNAYDFDKDAPRSEMSEPLTPVHGTITDVSTGVTIPGVNVLIKGTTQGTSSDENGDFGLDANDNDILIFSFIGFKTVETPVNGRSLIDISMESDFTTLEDVVVHAGYYDVKDREKTGNISKITASVIDNQPVSNTLQALQGRIPGISINQTNGLPGSNFQVRIRGTNSITNGNDPLYIIDGIPFISQSLSDENTSYSIYGSPDQGGGISPLNSINPSDIESVEVLKDADATAIYGSRGANGVVLITTKRGKSGGVKIDINLKTGFSQVTSHVNLLNTDQYIAMRQEAVHNDGDIAPKSNEFDINGIWGKDRNTDWQKELLGGVAKMNDFNASISGGGTDTQFLFSTGYNDQTTALVGSNSANRFSSHFSITHGSPNKKISVKYSNMYAVNTSNILSADLTSLALSLPPNAPRLYDPTGNLNWENSTWFNPLAYLKNRFASNTYNFIANAELGFKVAKNIRISANIGYNDLRNDERLTESSDARDPADHVTPASSRLTIGTGTNRSFIVEPQANWETEIRNHSHVSILIGGTYQTRIQESQREIFEGFPSNALIDNPKAATSFTLNPYNYTDYRYAALYGRLNYNWNGKYILNVTGRRDASSRFGPGKKIANLGAIGGAWIFTDEPFAKGIPFLSFGKLRSSYGITGNDQIGDYRYLDNYSPGTSYQNTSSLAPIQLFNPDYGWEVNRKLEGALEIGLLNDRLLISSAYYVNRSSNQLIEYQLAATTGYQSVLLNSPATVQNRGIELELTATNINKNNFKWITTANISFPRNKLIAFPNLESSTYAQRYVIGKPLNISKVFHYLGVDPTSGVYQFEDMNGDNKITLADKQSIVIRSQFYAGGVTNSFSYRGFQADVLFQFVRLGTDINPPAHSPGIFSSLGVPVGNVQSHVLEGRWQQPGDNATKQYLSRSPNMEQSHYYYTTSDGVATTVTYVRLKNISISYQLRSKWLGLTKSRLFVQGQNLIMFTNYRGLDPETSPNSMPLLMTCVAGLQLSI